MTSEIEEKTLVQEEVNPPLSENLEKVSPEDMSEPEGASIPNNLEEASMTDNVADGVKPSEKESSEENENVKDIKESGSLEAELLDFEEELNTNNDSGGDKNAKSVADEDGTDKKLLDSSLEIEDGACDSEGELNDAEDLEEGELREPSAMSDTPGQPQRQVCRFFHRGSCFYGSACRFLHLTNNQKGNYSMFETTTGGGGGHAAHRTQHTSHTSGFQTHMGSQRQPPRVPDFIANAPIPSFAETAWEKGLREARNLLKQAHQKRNDPNFAEKKLSLSLCVNERNIPVERDVSERLEFKKNHFSHEKERENFSRYDAYDSHMYNERQHDKDPRDHPPRHLRKESDDRRFSKQRKDIDRPFFVEEYFDPWRRSKSPNRLSRERSHSSFSSYSSPPYSRSSGSRSPASSRSSSRSPSVQQKRKVSPVPETAVSPKVSSNRFGPVKKKPGPRTSSSRSRSRNSTSRSRSISMDSVSSASQSRNSSPSHSSSDSEHEIKEKSMTNPDSTMENKFRGIGNLLASKRDLLEEKFEEAPEIDLRYLIPKIPEKKEPVRLALTHKNPIKLTLLNKFPQPKPGFSKDSKEFGVKKLEEPIKLNLLQGVKRPLSPNEPAEPLKQTPALLPKKSASSRRDELLKQLKAVEDAIARKRAKF